jgi:hypothetical protein
MQVKQTIINAIYSIEDLEKDEYDLIKWALNNLETHRCFQNRPEKNQREILADRLLSQMN